MRRLGTLSSGEAHNRNLYVSAQFRISDACISCSVIFAAGFWIMVGLGNAYIIRISSLLSSIPVKFIIPSIFFVQNFLIQVEMY